MQEIDLYPEILRSKRDVLSPRTLMIALGLYLCVLVSYAGNAYFDLYQTNKKLATARADNEQIRALAQETEEIAKTKTLDESLIAMQEQLKADISVKGQQLALIEVIGVVKNISSYETLKDLQRYHQENMWLEEINILNSGRDIFLRGYALNEKIVPQYLGGLQHASAFKDKKFKVIRINKQEDGPNLEFILSSQLLASENQRGDIR